MAKLKSEPGNKELEQLLESAVKRHPDLEEFLRNPNAPLYSTEHGVNGSINSKRKNVSVFSKRGDA